MSGIVKGEEQDNVAAAECHTSSFLARHSLTGFKFSEVQNFSFASPFVSAKTYIYYLIKTYSAHINFMHYTGQHCLRNGLVF